MAAAVGPVMEVAEKYKGQFQAAFETLRQRGSQLSEEAQGTLTQIKEQAQSLKETAEPKAMEMKEQVAQAAQDMEPLPDEPKFHQFILETYLWTAVCLVGLSIGQLFGSYILPPFLGVVFDTWVTVFLAYVALPVWFYLFNRKATTGEEERRMVLFGVALILGLLTGYNLSDRHLHIMAPPAFILPATVGISSGIIGPKFAKNRQLYLAGTVGVAVGIYFLLGFITRSFGLTFLIWVAVSSAATVLNLQLVLGKAKTGAALDPVQCGMCAVLTAMAVQATLLFLLGVSREAAKEAAAAQDRKDADSARQEALRQQKSK